MVSVSVGGSESSSSSSQESTTGVLDLVRGLERVTVGEVVEERESLERDFWSSGGGNSQ